MLRVTLWLSVSQKFKRVASTILIAKLVSSKSSLPVEQVQTKVLVGFGQPAFGFTSGLYKTAKEAFSKRFKIYSLLLLSFLVGNDG